MFVHGPPCLRRTCAAALPPRIFVSAIISWALKGGVGQKVCVFFSSFFFQLAAVVIRDGFENVCLRG